MEPSAKPGTYEPLVLIDRKSTRLNSSHGYISYAVFCLKKKKTKADPSFGLPEHRSMDYAVRLVHKGAPRAPDRAAELRMAALHTIGAGHCSASRVQRRA